VKPERGTKKDASLLFLAFQNLIKSGKSDQSDILDTDRITTFKEQKLSQSDPVLIRAQIWRECLLISSKPVVVPVLQILFQASKACVCGRSETLKIEINGSGLFDQLFVNT